MQAFVLEGRVRDIRYGRLFDAGDQTSGGSNMNAKWNNLRLSAEGSEAHRKRARGVPREGLPASRATFEHGAFFPLPCFSELL
jgi:hypothetical protein